jgi:alkanesulfonate monooxygenase SsuD/methylene tetrahydromethanopterin reductase-like flavin-dependent oxidoreductase (luciferase family)
MYHGFIKRFWDRYAELHDETFGGTLEPGAKRMYVMNIHIDDTHEKAVETARPGHDEFWKFLGPYGWSRGYRGEDGKPVGPGLIPTLEESVEQKVWIVGSPEEVAAEVGFYRELLGMKYCAIVPQFPGETYQQADEQMTRYVEEVMPLLNLAPAAAP